MNERSTMVPPRIELKNLSALTEMNAVVGLQAKIWGYGLPGIEDPYPTRALVSIHESGGLVAGAFHGSELIGFSLGWLGKTKSTGTYYLHSQLLGVHPGYRRLGVAYRLKLQQRSFALQEGLPLVRWTFDPLRAANASLNLHKLGALVQSYSEDLYGAMRNGFSGRDPSDRLWADWYVDSPRVERHLASPRKQEYKGVPKVLRTVTRQSLRGQIRVPEELASPLSAPEMLLEIPLDYATLQKEAPEVARRWRSAIRDVLCLSLVEGYVVDDLWLTSLDGFGTAYYHLVRKELQKVLV